MGSQLDLDQGGTFREGQKLYLGPSVGWVQAYARNVLPVTVGGTTTVLVGTTLIPVNFAGLVSIQLPSALASANTPANSLPGPSVAQLVTVVDILGHADTNNITLLPFGTETIMGLASIAITTPFGSYTLRPSLVAPGTWTQAAG